MLEDTGRAWRVLASATLVAVLGGAAAFGLSAARRLPPPTPAPGFYRLEILSGHDAGTVVAHCFARGHGGLAFGESQPPRNGRACGDITVTRVGDAWDARQQCTDYEGVGTFQVNARRQSPSELEITISYRPRSSRGTLHPNQVLRLRRISQACPAPLRPGESVVVSPLPNSGFWTVMRQSNETWVRDLRTLPPAIAALAREPDRRQP